MRGPAAAIGAALAACALAAGSAALQTEETPLTDVPLTAAEQSGWRRTSTHGEVLEFLAALEALPGAQRLERSVFGESEEGRELVVVAAGGVDPARPGEPELRVLVNANIHGGEVEGKEAVQQILREIALGEHEELLRGTRIYFVPVYNADGNDRIAPANRVSQNGPDGGVGVRANARGLDLNRDFVKAESAECRALLGLFRRHDPHLFVDLHTTNGSYHGYHLTYSPSLATNVDPDLDAFQRGELLPAIRAAMAERHGYRVFDYGNFTGGEERRWVTYDHRPRFGTNYYGVRGRLGLLSEAYSYLDLETRVAVTRAFVLESLAAAAAARGRILALCAAADRRLTGGGEVRFGTATALAPPAEGEILVGSVAELELPEGLGVRRVASPDYRAERMGVQLSLIHI